MCGVFFVSCWFDDPECIRYGYTKLVGGFQHFVFSLILGIIDLTYVFQRCWNHQPDKRTFTQAQQQYHRTTHIGLIGQRAVDKVMFFRKKWRNSDDLGVPLMENPNLAPVQYISSSLVINCKVLARISGKSRPLILFWSLKWGDPIGGPLEPIDHLKQTILVTGDDSGSPVLRNTHFSCD